MLLLSSCATTTQCLDVDQEPVSICRAEKACKSGWKTFGVFLGGLGGGANHASNSIESCMDNNIAAQKANAGIVSNNYRCISKDVGNGKVETQCTQQ